MSTPKPPTKTRLYRLKYEFTGTDNVQLTVKKDDIVTAPITANMKEEWLLVEQTKPPRKRGYIPTAYVTPLAQPAETPKKPSPASTPLSARSTLSSISSPRLRRRFETSSIRSRKITLPVSANESMSECFARHDAFFKQAGKARDDIGAAADRSLTTAAREITSCQDVTKKLVQRIAELQGFVGAEHARLADAFQQQHTSLVERGLLPSHAPCPAALPLDDALLPEDVPLTASVAVPALAAPSSPRSPHTPRALPAHDITPLAASLPGGSPKSALLTRMPLLSAALS